MEFGSSRPGRPGTVHPRAFLQPGEGRILGWRGGFTLIELLVVISILAVLLALLMPALASARQASKRGVCLSNLRQIGIAVHTYADDFEGKIPFGPKAPPFTSPASFYPSTGAPTSLLSLRGGAPVALGLLLPQYLGSDPKVLFCPGADQPLDSSAELAKIGTHQAQCSYYYRHGSTARLFDDPTDTSPPAHIHLDQLGMNRNGAPIRALALDGGLLCPPDLTQFNLKPRTFHRQKFVNILFSDGHVGSRRNADARFTVDLRNYAEVDDGFNKILQVFERADLEP